MAFKAKELAEMLGGTLEGDPDIVISGLAKIEEAQSGDVTFMANPKYERFLKTTKASLVLVSDSQATPAGNYIRVPDPYTCFALLLTVFHPPETPPAEGVHPTAFIAEDTQLGQGVRIGALVAIGSGCVLGNDVTIYPGAHIGDGVQIGDATTIRSGVSVRMGVQIGSRVLIQDNAVIGSDGFGFAPKESGEFEKIPQVGTVIIEDDVEIGAGCTIDRATLGATRIEKGVKLDNLIQVAHNVVIGAHTVIAAQSGISGSTEIGKNCMIAGQVGFVGHIKLGDGSLVGAQSGISRTFPPGSKLFGTPARDHGDELRILAVKKNLPDLAKQVTRLEKEIAELKSRLEEK
jgi:UDP-3-O-[3-hydroxymyristoyl] glucosamine N-acyltransferase